MVRFGTQDRLRTTIALLRLAAWLSLISALQGCAVGFIGARAIDAALESRPDRRLDYRITVRTVEGQLLAFKGSTECPHGVGAVSGRGAYSTKTPYVTLEHNQQQWVLTGIDCELAIKKNGEGMEQYLRLYKPIDGSRARVYFFHPLGSAQVVEAAFASSYQGASAAPASYYSQYSEGPYLYRKVFLAQTPEELRSLKRPTIVYPGSNRCGQANGNGFSIDEKTYRLKMRSAAAIAAYEEGRLSLQEKERDRASGGAVWSTSPAVIPNEPLDAAAPAGGAAGCVAFGYRDEIHWVSDAAVLYLPDEAAFYRIARATQESMQRRAKDEGWKTCDYPGALSMRPGRMYQRPSRSTFVRRESDGTFSCSQALGWP